MNHSLDHKRVNDTLLGSLERPALRWLAVHSPGWMTPDIYTIIGVVGSIIIFVGYVLSRFNPGYFWLATFGFLVNWLGDSMDGTLARHRHIERPVYGFFIDHTLDALSEVIIFTGLGLSPYVNFNVACLVLVGYLLLSVLVYIRTYLVGEFRISYSMLGPTEVRVLAILLNAAMFFFGAHSWHIQLGNWGSVPLTPYDIPIGVIGLLLLFFFLSTTFQEAVRLAKAGR